MGIFKIDNIIKTLTDTFVKLFYCFPNYHQFNVWHVSLHLAISVPCNSFIKLVDILAIISAYFLTKFVAYVLNIMHINIYHTMWSKDFEGLIFLFNIKILLLNILLKVRLSNGIQQPLSLTFSCTYMWLWDA